MPKSKHAVLSASSSHRVTVTGEGMITIDGVSTQDFIIRNTPLPRFSFVKYDAETARPLPGAGFTLNPGQRDAVSGESGLVDFGVLDVGEYVMTESAVPDGYLPNPHEYRIVVPDAGKITVDGIPLNAFSVENTRTRRLAFFKRHALTGAAVSGAKFTLSTGTTAVSDEAGLVDLGALAPGEYTMTESAAPAGYYPNSRVYQVSVADGGEILVDGTSLTDFTVLNTPYPELNFLKLDRDSGLALAGASFVLNPGSSAVSGEDGYVRFGPLAPGIYTLRELQAPTGYIPIGHEYQVVVTDEGSISVDGVDASEFSVQNYPYQEFYFFKYTVYHEAPLPGAEFRLSNGRHATSDKNGLVNFGVLPPGDYVMEEVAVPEGYQILARQFQVQVQSNGGIFIDGTPAHELELENERMPDVSAPPSFYTAVECEPFITGEGKAGAAVTVLLPDGDKVTTTVLDRGVWLAPVPEGTVLQAGEKLEAAQTEVAKLESRPVTTIVASRN